MSDLGDCTEVLQMHKAFHGLTGRKQLNPMSVLNTTGKLNFEDSLLYTSSSSKFAKSSVSIGSMIEKDEECKAKEAKLLEANVKIAELQAEVATVESTRKRQRIEMEHELENTKQNGMYNLDIIEDLRQQLRRIQRHQEETKTSLNEARQELSTTKANLNAKVAVLQREKLELESQIDQIENTSRGQMMELKKERMRQQAEINICQSELSESREQLAMSQKRCSDLKKQLQELEEYRLEALKSSCKVKDLEATLSEMQGDAVVTKAMKSQLDRLGELECENRKLKDENAYCKNTQENVHMLREELRSSTEKLSRAEIRAAEATKLQAQCQDLQERLNKWESCSVTGANRPSSPMQVSRQIQDLQQSHLLSLEKQGELQASALDLEQALNRAQTDLRMTKVTLEHEQHKTAQNTDFVKRLQRKLLLLKKERDSYRQMLDSYERETKASSSPGAARIRQLEQSLQSYHNQNATLEAHLEHAAVQRADVESKMVNLQAELASRLPHQTSAATSEVDQQIIASLREQVQEAVAEVERVTEARDTLAARIEQRHLQGDYDPVKTKVIHLTLNPASRAQVERATEVGRLCQENAQLGERIKLLEEGGAGAGDLTVRVQENLAQPSTSHEVEEMRSALTSAELKNKRLMEAFKHKSQEFREVCFQLLGYRIDIPTDRQYRLMNIYAESPEEFLVFQQNEGGMMELLSTEYSATLSDKVETYLQHADSIPAFLSSVTLQLFNRQTMFQQSMLGSADSVVPPTFMST